MRIVVKAHEITHLWAHQTQEHARSGTMSFRGKEFVSYNTVIARLVKGTAVITSNRYSSTTAKHLKYVRNAVSHLPRIYVPFPIHSAGYNLPPMQRDVNSLLDLAAKARTRQQEHLAKANDIVTNFNRYAELLESPLRMAEITDFNPKKHKEYLAAQAIKQAEELGAKRLLTEQRLQEHLSKWLNFETDNPPYGQGVHLRVKDDMVETSRGASIPVRHAKRIWPLIKAVRASGTDRVADIALGVFKLNRVYADGSIRAGCHLIKFEVLEQMAGTLELAN